ncbi:MAG: hypothetical protein JWQ04_3292 [Pedosphaera sp.]|nr:hypothetical protein [Pedosphaera sp.]
MRKIFNFLLAICILGLVLGLAGVGNNMISGFALAMGAVSFILAFIIRLIEKAETA